jgi:peptidoglycan LD-endopeptidase CwlK
MKDLVSVKRVATLHPAAKAKIIAFIEDAEDLLHTTFRVAQSFRTFEEQDAIFNQPHDGKDNDGDGKIDERDERVTKVKGGKSYHNYGLAVDLVEMKNGKPNWNYNYYLLEPIAKKHGLKWGYRLWGFDMPHFHMVFSYSVYQLLAKYQAGDFIPGTKYVNL